MVVRYLLIFVILFVQVSCLNSQQKHYTSPDGYDLQHPQVFQMPKELEEISGNAFYAGNKDMLYAIQDEDGYIYSFQLGSDKVQATRFGKKGDYEDVTIYKGTAIVLKSNGTLFSVPVSEIGKPKAEGVQEWKGLLPDGEYESLFADEKNKELYVMCKSCHADRKNSVVTVYVFDLSADSVQPKNNFTFDAAQLGNYIPSKKYILFKPSAIALNPLTDEWYLLSSVNKLLVVTDRSWKVKQVHELKNAVFEQPEGISFDANGNLYISSEAGENEQGVVMKFAYKPTK
ncbi:hypothetical protein A8C56_23035 [Niabella ginsenosidivorans]|uniref:SdiA-regulated family protein n=2 Tax=Niabella ginsenosidivorans TaxID=1176587 RepID=A0A1A9I931_9BACT|nr:hypothetical protein A8C56_23035 [Niabella ginsenosidivorans]